VTLLSLLSVFVGVRSDSKSFPYTPASVSTLCDKDNIHVLLVIDASTYTAAADYTSMVQHANAIASNLLTTFAGTAPIAISVFTYGNALTPIGTASATLTTVQNNLAQAAVVTRTGNARNTGNAIFSAATFASNAYARRVIYVIFRTS